MFQGCQPLQLDYKSLLIPAFAYTVHNSQGYSLNAACIDFTSSNELAVTYVMLSCIQCSEGFTILCPFPIGKINSHAPQAARNELSRLDALANASKEQAKKIYHGTIHKYFFPIAYIITRTI